MDALQQALQALEPRRPEDPDRRGFEWHYLQRLCQSDLRTLRGVSRVAFSPDGRRIVSASLDCRVKLWDAATGDEVLNLFRRRTLQSRLPTFSRTSPGVSAGADFGGADRARGRSGQGPCLAKLRCGAAGGGAGSPDKDSIADSGISRCSVEQCGGGRGATG
jgi:hypothetical protein